MKKFLKENWFKVGILLIGIILALSFTCSQYIKIVKHNINVLNETRQCIKDFEGETETDCVDIAFKNYLLKSFLYPDLEDNDLEN